MEMQDKFIKERNIGAREGLSDIITSKSLSHKKLVKLQRGIIYIFSITDLHKNHKVKEIQKDIYSYQIDKNSRLIIGETDNGIVLLDYIELREIHTWAHIDFSKLFYCIFKRWMDIIVSIFGILMMGIISVILIPAIKIESRGPITFSQVRIGKNGRRFKIHKFRSMYIDSERRIKNLVNGLKGEDPRITKIGRFIRRYGVDEFPVFFNILKGDMSLIGPRPPILYEYKFLEKSNSRISSVKPGLVGLTQLRYTEIKNFEDLVQLDSDYVTNMSITLDFRIMLKTIYEVSTSHSLTEMDDNISNIITEYAN